MPQQCRRPNPSTQLALEARCGNARICNKGHPRIVETIDINAVDYGNAVGIFKVVTEQRKRASHSSDVVTNGASAIYCSNRVYWMAGAVVSECVAEAEADVALQPLGL